VKLQSHQINQLKLEIKGLEKDAGTVVLSSGLLSQDNNHRPYILSRDANCYVENISNTT
jgi:hypothetical protein